MQNLLNVLTVLNNKINVAVQNDFIDDVEQYATCSNALIAQASNNLLKITEVLELELDTMLYEGVEEELLEA